MNQKPLWNKSIDYLVVCKDKVRAVRLYERFCEFLDGTHCGFKTLKDKLCILMLGSCREYRFISEEEKERFLDGFRGKVIDEHYFETWVENCEQY